MKEKSQLTNLQTEIQTRYDSLSKRLKQVAKYILDNSDSIVFDTVAVIAEKADVPRKDFNFHIKLLNQKVKNHQKIF